MNNVQAMLRALALYHHFKAKVEVELQATIKAGPRQVIPPGKHPRARGMATSTTKKTRETNLMRLGLNGRAEIEE